MDAKRLLNNSNLFNAADAAIAHDINFQDFEKSLFQNILFQESILLHEANFFNSDFLLRHAYRYGEGTCSLFAEAAKKGLVIPAISDPTNQDMENLYKFLVKKYGKNNNNFRLGLLKDARFKAYIRNIQIGWEARGNVQLWPDTYFNGEQESFGQGYERLVRSFFYKKDMPIMEFEDPNSDTVIMRRRVWKESEVWRNECFENALLQNKKYEGNSGLRRGDLFMEIAKSFKVEDPKKGVLLNYVLDYVENKETALCLKIYWSWLNQCYHMNFGDKMNRTINFPNYKSDSDILLDNKFVYDEYKNEKYDSFEFNIEMPTIQALKNTDPKKLIKLRTSSLGLEFFDSLKAFEHSKDDSDRDQLKNQLKLYTSGISNNVPVSQICKTKTSFLKSRGNLLSLAGVLTNLSTCFIDYKLDPYAVVIGSASVLIGTYDKYKKHEAPKRREQLKLEISIKKQTKKS